MKTGSNVITQRIAALPAKQKAIFFVSLCVVSIALVCASVAQAFFLIKKVKQTETLASAQRVWLVRSAKIEDDISNFGKSTAFGGSVDLAEMERNMEKVIVRTCSDYTFEKTADTQVGKFTVHRLKVTFNGVSLPNLIGFANEIEAMGNHIAISELKVNTKDKGLLAVHAIISVLSVR